MYDADSLAFTGAGLAVGGYILDMGWLALLFLALVAIGLAMTRLARPAPAPAVLHGTGLRVRPPRTPTARG